MTGSILLFFISIVLAILVFLTVLQLYSMYRSHHMKEILYDVVPPAYWPTHKWQISSPEELGMNSDKLLEMIAFYKQKNKHINIDSITIIRNEQIVADLYFNPLFSKDTKHVINSCTKSIIGLLIGIAIGKGYIENIEVPVLHFFDDIDPKDVDKRLKALTIKDLLTMRTGWHSQDSYLYGWTGLFKMQTSDDWSAHILNLPFETNPNTRFDYSNMASFLLSAIITKASGMSTLSFAEKHLFAALGIKDILWEKSPGGIYIGFARMWLKPHDMAKIGLLYLQKGKWGVHQLVPKSWVEDSIKAHSFPKQYRYLYKENNKKDFGASGANWVFTNLVRPLTDGYGYQWWLGKSGIFAAIGVGGQYLMVVPKERLILVVTSKLKAKDSFFPVTLLKKFIIPAIESQSPLPPNIAAQEELASYSISPTLQRESKPIVELPLMAKKISTKVYSIDSSVYINPWQHDNLMLLFEPNEDYAVFSYKLLKNQTIKYEIGLNNQYRITNCNGKSYAAVGEWTSPNTFTIDYEIIGYSSTGKWMLTFNNEQIEIQEKGMTGEYSYTGRITESTNGPDEN